VLYKINFHDPNNSYLSDPVTRHFITGKLQDIGQLILNRNLNYDHAYLKQAAYALNRIHQTEKKNYSLGNDSGSG